MEGVKNCRFRIMALRQKAGETQEELAAALGLDPKKGGRDKINNWENGRSRIDIENLTAIALHYHVSADYLLGLYDYPTTDKDLTAVCDYTGLSPDTIERLREIPSFIGGKESFPLLDEALFRFSSDLCFSLSRIEKASAAVQPVFDCATSVTRENWGEMFDALSAAKKELELSLFSFSELSHDIAEDMFSAYSNLREFNKAFDDVVIMGSDKERYGGSK